MAWKYKLERRIQQTMIKEYIIKNCDRHILLFNLLHCTMKLKNIQIKNDGQMLYYNQLL